jgi:hypothetical protein
VAGLQGGRVAKWKVREDDGCWLVFSISRQEVRRQLNVEEHQGVATCCKVANYSAEDGEADV